MAPDRSERDRPRPMAGGNLRSVPLSHVFLHLYAKLLEGTLVVRPVGRPPILIKMERGRPRALRSAEMASGDLQTLLLPLCGLTDGEYEFYASDLMATPGPAIRGSVDPLALVSASLIEFARDDIAGALLSRYGTRHMRLQPGQPIDRLGLDRKQQRLVDLLRAGPESVAMLVKLSPLSQLETQRLLYLLVITKIVAPMEKTVSGELPAPTFTSGTPGTPGTSGQPSSSSARMPSNGATSASHVRMSSVAPPPASLRPSSQAPVQGRRSGVSFTVPDARTAERTPPFSTAPGAVDGQLSLPPGVAEGQGASGPDSSARAWSRRPSSMAATGVSSSHPNSRHPNSRHPNSGRPGRGFSGPVAPVTPGEQFKLAEKRLLAGYPDEALTIVDGLLKAEPKRGAFLGLRAQALFVAMRTPPGQPVADDVSKAIQEALVVDEEEPRALYTKGLSFQQVGKLKQALRFFRRACEADKGFIAAKRDAHIVETRLRQGK